MAGSINVNVDQTDNTGDDHSKFNFHEHLMSKFDESEKSENIFNHDCDMCEIENLDPVKCNKMNTEYSIMHINIQSLPAKLSKLEVLINRLAKSNIEIQFILLCETFLNQNNAHLYNIEGYTFISRHRQTIKRGGVGIYVKNDIKFIRRTDLEINREGVFESVFIQTQSQNKKNAIIGEIYRVPGTNETESINAYDNILVKLNNEKRDIFIGTDQNYDYIKINQHKKTADLLNVFLNNAIIPTITKPTRITHQSATLIDNIYTKIKSNTFYSAVLMTDISDHQPICLFTEKAVKNKKKSLTFFARKLNCNAVDKITNALEHCDWNILDSKTTEEAFIFFTDKVKTLIDRYAPSKLIQIPSKQVIQNPWITKGLLISSQTLDKLYKLKINKPKTNLHYINYINHRNVYNNLKRLTKKQYFSEQLDLYKMDIRKTWQTLNQIIGRKNDKTSLSEFFEIDGKKTNNPLTISNGFCKYFSEVGQKFADAIPKANKHFAEYLTSEPCKNSMFFTPTDPEEIDKIITSLLPKTSCGVDNISTKLLKMMKSSIKVPLTKLINKSLESGVVPQIMKIAKVIPLYKGKNAEQCTNYRPISLLPSISKILEKIVHKRLYHFLTNQRAFYDSQYGFRPGYSTIAAITEFSSKLLESFDNKLNTIGVFLDLSKAFDTINHTTLLNKLRHYGIRGQALEWFRSYLSSREQFVMYKNTTSLLREVTCGVPQGSVLGPLLFIIYTNDLPNALRFTRCVLFADDTTVYYSSRNLEHVIQNISADLKNLTEWFKANKLSLNITKTNYMLFTKNDKDYKRNMNLRLSNEDITRVNSTKFLGMIIDDKLNWQSHIEHTKNKISSGLYALNKSKHVLGTKHLKTLYYSLIHPYITYGLLLWGSASKSLTKRIEIMQNKAIRSITNSKYNASALPLYKQLKILPLKHLYEQQLGKLMYMHSKHILPLHIQKLFTPNNTIHTHGTRHANDPHFHHVTSSQIMSSFMHKAPAFWYQLSPHIKDSITTKTFIFRIKKHLLDILC